PQDTERRRLRRTDGAVPFAHRTGGVRARDRGGAKPLPGDLHQAEPRDPADVVTRFLRPHRLAQRALDVLDVALDAHVDEVDDDDAAEIAQAQLPRHFARGLEIGLVRGLFLTAAAHRAARVDVDRGQRLGAVDHDRAARLERDAALVDRLD